MFRQTGNSDPGPSATGEVLVTGSGGGGGSNVTIVDPIGQDTMANSVSVVIASNQSDLPVVNGADPLVVEGEGTAGSPSIHVLTAQGITGMTPFDVNVLSGGGSNASVGATGAAVPASGTYVGINLAGNLSGAVAGHGTAASALRVELPTDGTGTLATVAAVTAITNPVTAIQGTATSLKTQAENYQGGVAVSAAAPLQVTLANTGANATAVKVDGSAATQPVSGTVAISSQVPGTGGTNLGKAEDNGHTTADTGVFVLAVRQDSPDTATTNTTADYSQISVSSTGAVRNAPISEDFAALANGPQVKKYYTNSGAVTDGIIWSPASGKRWYVTDIFIGVSAACTATLEDDKAGGDEAVWKMEFAANSGWSHTFATPLFSGEDAADLMITTSAGNVYVMATGYEI